MFTAALFILFLMQQQPAADSCIACHEENAVQFNNNDVHARRGLSCAGCHGGDPKQSDAELAMNPRSGFVGVPARNQIRSFCGKCHSNAERMRAFNPALRVDQEAEYVTSVHGKRIAEGNEGAATCVSCHGNHGVLAVADPNSPVHPTHVANTCGGCHADQQSAFVQSVHGDALLKGQDLSAPTCNDCHGNHGAAPPDVTSVANVCGTCHARQADLFRASPHQPAFEAIGLAECIECHGNHAVLRPHDSWIGAGPDAVCTKCHSTGEPGMDVALALHQRLVSLDAGIVAADSDLERAARAGMEVSRSRFELNDARDSLINGRVLIHSFSLDTVDNVTTKGLEIAGRAKLAAADAMAELRFRRQGLAVSLILIGLAIVGVYLKIRQIEEEP